MQRQANVPDVLDARMVVGLERRCVLLGLESTSVLLRSVLTEKISGRADGWCRQQLSMINQTPSGIDCKQSLREGRSPARTFLVIANPLRG